MLKRPHLVHFLAIKTDEHIALKASVTMKAPTITVPGANKEISTPSFPVQALRMLNAYLFHLKITGLNKEQKEVYKKVVETDSFGNLSYKIPLTQNRDEIEVFQIYEVRKNPGLELLLGTHIPLKITPPKKLIICDFDKTLVDTKYSSTKEVYQSLTRPLEYFPTVHHSLEILRSYIDQGHHPFVLSASPHFYEEAMRDWLYQNQVYTAGIFLKDYRKVFSFLEWDLSPKDLKVQGLYKLNHLLDIILMTGVPDSLVLMGDNFESDPIIYLTLARLLKEESEPWSLWNQLKKQDAFQLNRKQNAQFLNKIYQIQNLINRKKGPRLDKLPIDIKVYIRKKANEEYLEVLEQMPQFKDLFELYEGRATREEVPEQKIEYSPH